MLWGPTSLWTWDFSQGWRKMLNLLYFQQPHPGFKRPYKKYQNAGPLRITALWCGPIYRVLVYWGFTSTNGLSLQWPTYWHPIVAMELQFWSTPTLVHLLLKSPQVWNWKHVFFFCYVESNLKNDCGKHWHRNWGILVFKMLVGDLGNISHTHADLQERETHKGWAGRWWYQGWSWRWSYAGSQEGWKWWWWCRASCKWGGPGRSWHPWHTLPFGESLLDSYFKPALFWLHLLVVLQHLVV